MSHRPDIAPFLISTRRNWEDWPKADREVLRKAQRDHDAGLVTMCQGREGSLILQYAIPTKKRVKRLPYFTQETFRC